MYTIQPGPYCTGGFRPCRHCVSDVHKSRCNIFFKYSTCRFQFISLCTSIPLFHSHIDVQLASCQLDTILNMYKNKPKKQVDYLKQCLTSSIWQVLYVSTFKKTPECYQSFCIFHVLSISDDKFIIYMYHVNTSLI